VEKHTDKPLLLYIPTSSVWNSYLYRGRAIHCKCWSKNAILWRCYIFLLHAPLFQVLAEILLSEFNSCCYQHFSIHWSIMYF